MERHIESVEALEREARELVTRLMPGERATLVTLSGELGAGKTTFAQAVAKALGVEEHVTSPTFVLEKIYELESAPFRRLVHIDAYRLEGGAALKALGFAELSADPDNLILLEWPERVADGLPSADISMTLVPNPDGSRTLTYG
jgi:tRNA threonylcarbamoyladenosine biosynthesis protein TsaE